MMRSDCSHSVPAGSRLTIPPRLSAETVTTNGVPKTFFSLPTNAMFEALRVNMASILRKVACDNECHSRNEADRILEIRQAYGQRMQHIQVEINAASREMADLERMLLTYGIRA